jgi:hypothetical protein
VLFLFGVQQSLNELEKCADKKTMKMPSDVVTFSIFLFFFFHWYLADFKLINGLCACCLSVNLVLCFLTLK